MQVKPGNIGDFYGQPRDNWNLKGFIRENKEALLPVAVNFMYVNSSRTDLDLELLMEGYDSES